MSSDHPNLTVFDHPLIQHKLATVRDKSSSFRTFRALVSQIAGLMVYEVTRGFHTERIDIDTPMERTECVRVMGLITLVPIMRAGLGMAEGILDVMPEARVGHLGMFRDEETLQPVPYLEKLPSDLGAGPVILVDPMLATGGSAVASCERLRHAGAVDLRMICLVAAPAGVERMAAAHPDVQIYAASLDRGTNERGFILPGLGDAGDRMYGTT